MEGSCKLVLCVTSIYIQSIVSRKSNTKDGATTEDDSAFAKFGLSNVVKLKNLNKLFSSEFDVADKKTKHYSTEQEKDKK